MLQGARLDFLKPAACFSEACGSIFQCAGLDFLRRAPGFPEACGLILRSLWIVFEARDLIFRGVRLDLPSRAA